MATTTNYGWATPDDTALVKDGASAIRTLGSSVDTTTKALNPSTTLGDIEYRSSTANTNTRLAIGTTGQVLNVSGGVPAWTTLQSGGMTLLSTTTLSGSSTTISSISQDYKDLYILGRNAYSAAAQSLYCRFNGDNTSANYNSMITLNNGGTISGNAGLDNGYIGATSSYSPPTWDTLTQFNILIPRYTETQNKFITSNLRTYITNHRSYTGMMVTGSTTAISSITFASDSTFSGGTIYIYGVK